MLGFKACYADAYWQKRDPARIVRDLRRRLRRESLVVVQDSTKSQAPSDPSILMPLDGARRDQHAAQALMMSFEMVMGRRSLEALDATPPFPIGISLGRHSTLTERICRSAGRIQIETPKHSRRRFTVGD